MSAAATTPANPAGQRHGRIALLSEATLSKIFKASETLTVHFVGILKPYNIVSDGLLLYINRNEINSNYHA